LQGMGPIHVDDRSTQGKRGNHRLRSQRGGVARGVGGGGGYLRVSVGEGLRGQGGLTLGGAETKGWDQEKSIEDSICNNSERIRSRSKDGIWGEGGKKKRESWEKQNSGGGREVVGNESTVTKTEKWDIEHKEKSGQRQRDAYRKRGAKKVCRKWRSSSTPFDGPKVRTMRSCLIRSRTSRKNKQLVKAHNHGKEERGMGEAGGFRWIEPSRKPMVKKERGGKGGKRRTGEKGANRGRHRKGSML